jgi:hypothetical protein
MQRKGRDRRLTSVSEQVAIRLPKADLAEVRKYGAGMGGLSPAVKFFLRLGIDTWLAGKVGDGLSLGAASGLEAEMREVLK